MTEQELAELRRVYERTTPGVWAISQPYASWLVHVARPGEEDAGLTQEQFLEGVPEVIAYINSPGSPDAEFIALAHRMMPRLLDYIAALREEKGA